MRRIRSKVNSLRKDSVLANSFWLMVNTVVLTGMGFLFWTIVARYYDESSVGLASTLISALNLIVAVSGLGLGVAIIRFIRNSAEPNKNLNTVFLVSTLLAIAISSVFVLFIGIFSPKLGFLQHNLYYGILFIIGVVSTLIFGFLDSVFLSYDKPYLTVIKSAIFSLIKLVLPPFLIIFGVSGIFGSWVLGTLAGVGYGIVMLVRKKLYTPKLEIHENILIEILPFSFGNYLSNLVKLLPTLVFPLIITETINPQSTAYYYTALMIAGLLYIIPNATSNALLSEGSKNPDSYKNSEKKAMALSALLLIPSVIVMLVISPYILLLLGKNYSQYGQSILRIFSIGSFAVAINFFYSAKLNMEKRVGTLFFTNALVVIVTFATYYLYFKKFGLDGAGYSWLTGLVATVPFYVYEKLRAT